jgi:hypothetical protein
METPLCEICTCPLRAHQRMCAPQAVGTTNYMPTLTFTTRIHLELMCKSLLLTVVHTRVGIAMNI